MTDRPHSRPGTPLETVLSCLACGGGEFVHEVRVAAQMQPLDAPPESFDFVRCATCGLVFLNPRVPAEGLGPYYTDAYLPYRGPDAWGAFAPLVASGLRGTDRKRVALVRRHAGPGPGTRVLDVGCGKPSFLEALVEATGCDGVGTDFSDSGWADAPERWRRLELRVGDLHDLDFSDPVQVVTMWHYLEHDYAPGRTLDRVRELVGGDPAARLFIEVPDHDSGTRRRHGKRWAGYHAPRHAALYTPDTLRTLLEGRGWEVVEIFKHGSLDPYVLEWMSRMEASGIDWTTSMAPRFPRFLAGKVAWTLRHGARGAGEGIMTAVARPAV